MMIPPMHSLVPLLEIVGLLLFELSVQEKVIGMWIRGNSHNRPLGELCQQLSMILKPQMWAKQLQLGDFICNPYFHCFAFVVKLHRSGA